MRTLEELIVAEDPAWPIVQTWIGARPIASRYCRSSIPAGCAYLGQAVRVCLRSVPDWNEGIVSSPEGTPAPFLLIADDVIGGFFAIDGGGITGSPGSVHYFAPDSLGWQNLNLSYSDFVRFALSGDVEGFYRDLRWSGWLDEIADLPGDRALSVYPFMWTEGPPISERSRRSVPVAELWAVQQDMRSQLRGPASNRLQQTVSSRVGDSS